MHIIGSGHLWGLVAFECGKDWIGDGHRLFTPTNEPADRNN